MPMFSTDPHAAGATPSQHPDNQESHAGHWQKIMDSAQQYWSQLSLDDVEYARRGRRELIEVLQSRYRLTAEEADERIEKFLADEPRKGWFERLTSMNGDLRVNQYVSNPAPGPSARDDQPPSVTSRTDDPADKY